MRLTHVDVTSRFGKERLPAFILGVTQLQRQHRVVFWSCRLVHQFHARLLRGPAGLAVIADGSGEASYVIQDNENGILVSDESEMTEAMLSLAQDESLRKRISENAVRTAEEKYSMEVLGEKLAGFLRQFGN